VTLIADIWRLLMTELVSKTEACKILGFISEATLWRGVRTRRFPQPIKLGKFIARWSRAELEDCILKLMNERAP
jgi:predicted DNA-binding transcriptional regulator AlpA